MANNAVTASGAPSTPTATSITTTSQSSSQTFVLPSKTQTSIDIASTYATTLSLTTTFTPDPACTKSISFVSYQNGTDTQTDFFAGWISYYTGTEYSTSIVAPTDCYPYDFANVLTQTDAAYYYSPGICPSGWAQVTTTVATTGNTAWKSGETAALCCPSAYAVSQTDMSYEDWDDIYLCQSGFPRGATAKGLISVTASGDDLVPIAKIWSTTLDHPQFAKAAAIQVRWRSSDTFPNSSPSSGGLAKSAIIAIAVVVPIVVLGLTIGLVLLFLRRRQRKHNVDKKSSDSDLPEAMTESYQPNVLVEAPAYTWNDENYIGTSNHAQNYSTVKYAQNTDHFKPVTATDVVQELPYSQMTSSQSTTLRPQLPIPSDSEGLIPVEGGPSIPYQPNTPARAPYRESLEMELLQVRREREQRELEHLRQKEQALTEELSRLKHQ